MTMRQELALKTRENIIESAKKVISEKGFKEASIQDITQINNLKPVELDKIGYDSESVRIILKSSIEKGELKKDAPIEEIVGFIISTIYGMMLSWCMTDRKYEPQEHIDIITEFILNGIKPYRKGDF